MNNLKTTKNTNILHDLVHLQKKYQKHMLVHSKYQPNLIQHIFKNNPQSPILNYSTRCPYNIQYLHITPKKKITPYPYLPKETNNLHQQSFKKI